MQTPAEQYLVAQLARLLDMAATDARRTTRFLHIGAGRSVAIEQQLRDRGLTNFRVDRLDVDSCVVQDPNVRYCFRGSVEAMTVIHSGCYEVAFANYVLEHVPGIAQAASEIYRVLRPHGVFLATIPNPLAPEFLVARFTPLWFHKWVRGGQAWETHYAYRCVEGLQAAFQQAGFHKIRAAYFPFVSGYLARFGALRPIGAMYDRLCSHFGSTRLMGNVCLIAEKPCLQRAFVSASSLRQLQSTKGSNGP